MTWAGDHPTSKHDPDGVIVPKNIADGLRGFNSDGLISLFRFKWSCGNPIGIRALHRLGAIPHVDKTGSIMGDMIPGANNACSELGDTEFSRKS